MKAEVLSSRAFAKPKSVPRGVPRPRSRSATHIPPPRRYNGMKRSSLTSIATTLALLGLLTSRAPAAEAPDDEPWLHPYTGPSRSDVDATTLDGKVLCGYQGWFNTPGDGTSFGFTHWGQGLDRTNGGRFTVDMLPDVSEYDPPALPEVPGLKNPGPSPP